MIDLLPLGHPSFVTVGPKGTGDEVRGSMDSGRLSHDLAVRVDAARDAGWAINRPSVSVSADIQVEDWKGGWEKREAVVGHGSTVEGAVNDLLRKVATYTPPRPRARPPVTYRSEDV